MSSKDAFGQDIVVKVRPPHPEQEVGQFKDGARSALCLVNALLDVCNKLVLSCL